MGYKRTITKVRSVEKIDERYVINFSNGFTMGASEMQYKLHQEPKENDEYTVINNNGEIHIIKSYPKNIKRTTPSLRKKGLPRVPEPTIMRG